MKKNGEIEFLRFFMMLIIMAFHWGYHEQQFQPVPTGCLAVEFFFLLSGFLLASSVARRSCSDKAPLSWPQLHQENHFMLYRKVKAFLPELFLSCLIGCGVFILCTDTPFCRLWRIIACTQLGNALFLKMTGLLPVRLYVGLNGPAWYLSTLLLCSAVLYPMLRRWGISLVYLVTGIMLLSSLFVADPHFYFTPTQYIGYFLNGNIRGLAEMMIGISLYPILQGLKNCTPTLWGQRLLTALKWGCFLFVLLNYHYVRQFGLGLGLFMMALCVMLVLVFWEKCLDYYWYQHRIFLFLGRLSLPLFLSHHFYARFLPPCIPDSWGYIGASAAYYACAFLTAFAVLVASDKLRSLPPLIFKQQNNGG